MAIPSDEYFINNHPVTYEEFWKFGGGTFFIITGLLHPIIGLLFIKKKSIGRVLLVGFIVTIFVAESVAGIFVEIYRKNLASVLQTGLIVGLLTWYLFYKNSVKEYFTSK